MSIRELVSVMHKTTGCRPPKLIGASTTVVGDCVYLLGGRASSEQIFHMYIFNLLTQTWTKIPQPDQPTPSPRYLHSTDLWNGYLVVFGGIVINDPSKAPYALDDIWFFSLLESRWILPSDSSVSSRPSPRYGHLSSISADMLYIVGGQDKSDNWVDTMHLYDLGSRNWMHRCHIPYHCGTYRGLAASSNLRVIDPSGEGYGLPARFTSKGSTIIPPTPIDSFVELTYSTPVTKDNPSEINMYLNYDFTDLRRELRVLQSTNDPQNPFTLKDLTSDLPTKSDSVPPALRFPTGGIIGTYFVLSGIDITTRHSMSAWALNLQTLTWTKIEMSSSLLTGSWTRSVIWPSSNKLVIFGSREGDFQKDYKIRLLSWDDAVYIDLEALGIYRPPLLTMSNVARVMGLTALEDGAFADFEIVCDDGRGIACSRELLEHRWSWFHEERKKWNALVSAMTPTDKGALVPSPTPTPALPVSRADPRLTPRKLHLSEPYPVVVAFLQYFYTQSLMTPLQHAPAVLSSLMLLAATYDLSLLTDLVAHAMHGALSRSRSFAAGIFDVASLVGASGLRLRAFSIGRRPHALVTSNLENVACSHHPRKTCQQCYHHNDVQSGYTPSSSANPKHKSNDEKQQENVVQPPTHHHQHHRHHASRHSTVPRSVPTSAVPSPTGSVSASFLVDGTKFIDVRCAGNNAGGSTQRDHESPLSHSAATSDPSNGNLAQNVGSSQYQRDQVDFQETCNPIESGSIVIGSDHLIEERLLYADSDTVDTSSIPIEDSPPPRPQSPTMESQLLELREIVYETLGSIATGPFWKDGRNMYPNGGSLTNNTRLRDSSVTSVRRLSMNPEKAPLTTVEKEDTRPNSKRHRNNNASTALWVSMSSHGSAKMDANRTGRLEYGLGLGLSLGSSSETHTEDKGKGVKTYENTACSCSSSHHPTCKHRRHDYPASASASASLLVASSSLPVLVKQRERSTSVPQPMRMTDISASFVPSSGRRVVLPLANANPASTQSASKYTSPNVQIPYPRQACHKPRMSSLSRTGGDMQRQNNIRDHSSLAPVASKGSSEIETSSMVLNPALRPLPPFPPTPPLSEPEKSSSNSPSSFSNQKKPLANMVNERTTTATSPSLPAITAQPNMAFSPRLPTPVETSDFKCSVSSAYTRPLPPRPS